MTAHFTAHCDGSCKENPGGRGSWAFILSDGRKANGTLESTTSIRAELTAIFQAVKAVPPGSRLTVNSDSEWCVNTLKGVYRKATAHKDLRKEIAETIRTNKLSVTFKWVRRERNVAADALAEAAYTKATDRAPDALTADMDMLAPLVAGIIKHHALTLPEIKLALCALAESCHREKAA